MTPEPGADPLHLELILERIGLIRKSLGPLDYASFVIDADKVDSTAYRLSNIGESSRKLSSALKRRHDDVPWENIYRLRNIVVHAYETVKPELVWEIATTQLETLEAVCRAELDRLGG